LHLPSAGGMALPLTHTRQRAHVRAGGNQRANLSVIGQ